MHKGMHLLMCGFQELYTALISSDTYKAWIILMESGKTLFLVLQEHFLYR